MRSQTSSQVERYADYKTHCLHEIGWANAGVTTPIPLWVRNTGQPVDVPWFRWELSNRVPSSCPVRRIPRQDPLHTTGWDYIHQLHCIWQSLVFEVITYSLCNTWFVLWLCGVMIYWVGNTIHNKVAHLCTSRGTFLRINGKTTLSPLDATAARRWRCSSCQS